MTFEIAQDVPIPRAGTSRKYTSKYPLRTMKAGESFFVPVDDGGFIRTQRTIASAASRQGVKVVTRRVREDEKDGIRVWRRDDE